MRLDRLAELPEEVLRIAEHKDDERGVFDRRRDSALPIAMGQIVTRRAERLQPFSRAADRDHGADLIELAGHEVLERRRAAEAHPAGLEKVVAKLPQNQHRRASIAIA